MLLVYHRIKYGRFSPATSLVTRRWTRLCQICVKEQDLRRCQSLSFRCCGESESNRFDDDPGGNDEIALLTSRSVTWMGWKCNCCRIWHEFGPSGLEPSRMNKTRPQYILTLTIVINGRLVVGTTKISNCCTTGYLLRIFAVKLIFARSSSPLSERLLYFLITFVPVSEAVGKAHGTLIDDVRNVAFLPDPSVWFALESWGQTTSKPSICIRDFGLSVTIYVRSFAEQQMSRSSRPCRFWDVFYDGLDRVFWRLLRWVVIIASGSIDAYRHMLWITVHDCTNWFVN